MKDYFLKKGPIRYRLDLDKYEFSDSPCGFCFDELLFARRVARLYFVFTSCFFLKNIVLVFYFCRYDMI